MRKTLSFGNVHYFEDETITLPDGYNGDTVQCYAKPIEEDGNMLKLRVAEPGRDYMIKWCRMSTWFAEMLAE